MWLRVWVRLWEVLGSTSHRDKRKKRIFTHKILIKKKNLPIKKKSYGREKVVRVNIYFWDLHIFP